MSKGRRSAFSFVKVFVLLLDACCGATLPGGPHDQGRTIQAHCNFIIKRVNLVACNAVDILGTHT